MKAIPNNISNYVRRLHQKQVIQASDFSKIFRILKKTCSRCLGPMITLQNRALMNTRLRVLYTDENCSPFLAETGSLWAFQTKSVTLPTNAKNIKIIVQKDLFAETWRVAYNGTLSEVNKCIRITGVTFSSKIKPCK